MDQKKDVRVVPPPSKAYKAWESALLKSLKYTGGASSVAILELGCEKKMDNSKKTSERVYKLTKNSQRSTHIRISSEDLAIKGKPDEHTIIITDNVLNALNHIDKCLLDMKRRK
eukprot:NODE_10424_length_593_cov_61.725532_g10149_i0.p1 GENE.NODE_10424_length_593_cov_61.725532_g10149_i0~~NODE_10424_length_593_cov_61.725532_g10149_i0.p1  ORF type:complete len:114 (+),score=27.46 NODE_10424_length_593_cov_61.725532_g10149_i0:55-396(+)